MPLPEVIVRRGDRGAAPFPADDVSTRFEAVVSERGPVGEPIECRSWSQVRQYVGDHTTTSTLRAVESYFAEGGTRAVLSRVVGVGATFASLTLKATGGDDVLTVTAAGPGAWYHRVRVAVATAVATNDRRITVTLNGSTLVSGTCSSAAEAVELINRSGYAKAVVDAEESWPVAVPTDAPLAGGDDRVTTIGAIGEDQVIDALEAFDADLGAGSVCASGWGDNHRILIALADHAAANNRFARGDLARDLDVAGMLTIAGEVRRSDNPGHIQLFAGWLNVSVAGVTLPVPPSGVHTGREARADRENAAGPGQPCAWTFGEYRTPIGVATPFGRADREQLNDAGITVVTQDPQGNIYAEDAITAVDGTRFPQYAEVAGMRVTMAIHAQAQRVLRQRVMQTIDGQGHLAAITSGDLVAICAAWYERGALYGADASEAYSAVVTAEVEPGQKPRLVGYIALRPSPSTHTVELTITQVAPSDTI